MSRPPFRLIDQFIPDTGKRVRALSKVNRRKLACYAALLAIRVGGDASAEFGPSIAALRAAQPDETERARAAEIGARLQQEVDELDERIEAGDSVDDDFAEQLFRRAMAWEAVAAALRNDVNAAAADALYCAVYAVGNRDHPVEALLDAVLAGEEDPVARAVAAAGD